MKNNLDRTPGPQFSCGELTFCLYSKTVKVAGQLVAVSPLELDLLDYLARYQTRPIPADELLEAIWNCSDGGTVNQVKCCIGRLRKKLAVDEDTPQYIHSVRGFGNRLCKPEELPPLPRRKRG